MLFDESIGSNSSDSVRVDRVRKHVTKRFDSANVELRERGEWLPERSPNLSISLKVSNLDVARLQDKTTKRISRARNKQRICLLCEL